MRLSVGKGIVTQRDKFNNYKNSEVQILGKITLVRLLIKVNNMPPLPQSISQILELTKSTKSSAHDLTKVCEHDPKLTANMLKLANIGVTIMPANPGFYQNPKSLEDLVDFVVARILDHIGVEHTLLPRWGLE